jgi:hypothetical protein
MRETVMLWSFVLGLLALGGCDDRSREAGGGDGGKEGVTLDDVQREAGEALDATGEYLEKKKDELLQKMSPAIDELERKGQKLEEWASEKGDAAAQEFREARRVFEQKLADLKAELERAREAGAAAWGETSQGLEAGLEELKNAYDEAEKKMKTQQAPDTDSASGGDSPES